MSDLFLHKRDFGCLATVNGDSSWRDLATPPPSTVSLGRDKVTSCAASFQLPPLPRMLPLPEKLVVVSSEHSPELDLEMPAVTAV